MSQTLHIIRKDVRRLRGVLAIWVTLLIARVALSTMAPSAFGEMLDAGLFFRQLFSAVENVQLLMSALIAARLVHEEPLIGFNAFWLTRPYARGALFGAKLAFAAIVLVALPLFAHLITMMLFDAGPPALVRGGTSAALGYISWALSFMVIGALTPSLGAFVLTIVGVITAVSVLFTATFAVFAFAAEESTGYTPPAVPDATRGVVMLVVYVCAALSVIVYQYRRRQRRVAVALVLAGLVATLLIPGIWPWPFARAQEIGPGAWADAAVAVHDPSWGSDATDAGRGRGAPRRSVNARVMLSNMPAEFTVQSVGVRSRLQLPDGSVIESGQMGMYAPRDRTSPVEAALGAKLLAPLDPEGPREAWSPLLTLTEDEFGRYRGRSGRIDTTIDFHLVRSTETAALPLRVGAALDEGVSRLEIVDIQRRTDSRAITVVQWRARSPLVAERYAERTLYLRHRARGEALPAGVESSWPITGGAPSAVMLLQLPLRLMMGAGVSFSSGGEGGFSAVTQVLRVPGRGFGKVPRVEPAWYDGAELVVVETAPSGFVTRSLTIDNFTIPTEIGSTSDL